MLEVAKRNAYYNFSVKLEVAQQNNTYQNSSVKLKWTNRMLTSIFFL